MRILSHIMVFLTFYVGESSQQNCLYRVICKYQAVMAEWNIRPLTDNQSEHALEFLRQNFYPYEPCAKALDLCPVGYR